MQQQVPVYYPRAAVTTLASSDEIVPPDASIRSICIDDGNASPQLLRSSLYKIPQDHSIWQQSGNVPMGVIAVPLAVPSEDYRGRPIKRIDDDGNNADDSQSHENETAEGYTSQRIPVLHTQGGSAPPRCRHCNAYMNPFFGPDGTCNFCNTRNAQLANNYSQQSPSTIFGTVEYTVDGPYITREPQPVQANLHVYIVDLTCPHLFDYVTLLRRIGSDVYQHYVRQQHATNSQVSSSSITPPRIGVCFVSSLGVFLHRHSGSDSGMENGFGNHNHNHHPAVTRTHSLIIVPDVTEEPFAAIPLGEWTMDVSSEGALQHYQEFLDGQVKDDLQVWRQRVKEKNAYGLDGLELSCGGAAVAFLSQVLAETGGRGTLLTWRRPNFGVGSIAHRSGKARGKLRPDEDDLPCVPLQSQTFFRNGSQDETTARFYKELAATCVRNRVSLDIVIHTDLSLHGPFLDIATLSELCRTTSGNLIWIQTQDWQSQLYEELVRPIYSFAGWDVVFKLRCSEGLQVKNMVCVPGTTVESIVGSPEVEFSSLSSTSSLAVELEHRVGGIRKEQRSVYLQSATLYTTIHGQRRVRVSTLALPTTSSVKDVFRNMDFAAATTLILRKVVMDLRKVEGNEDVSLRTRARDSIFIQCVHMLAAYKKHTGSMTDQLLLPKRMEILPLFLMCLLKSPMLRLGVPVRMDGATSAVAIRPSNDERSFFQFQCATANPAVVMLLLYPRIFSISEQDLDSNSCGEWQPSQAPAEFNGCVQLPPALPSSLESLQDDGIYLIDGGLKVYLVVGKDVALDVKEQIYQQQLSQWNSRAAKILWQLRAFNSITQGCESEVRPTYAPLSLVYQQGDHQSPLELSMLDLMVEDAMGGQRDYNDFLMGIHSSIRSHNIS
jgi:hypothetical protein